MYMDGEYVLCTAVATWQSPTFSSSPPPVCLRQADVLTPNPNSNATVPRTFTKTISVFGSAYFRVDRSLAAQCRGRHPFCRPNAKCERALVFWNCIRCNGAESSDI